MWIVRCLFHFFVAWGCAVTFFDTSIFAVIVIVYLLECMRGKTFDARAQKASDSKFDVIFTISGVAIGGGLVVIGKFVIEKDAFIILGAIVLSIAIVMGINKLLIPYIQKLREK